MFKYLKRASDKAGLPPGTLVHVGEKKTEETRIRLLEFDVDTIDEKTLSPDDDFSIYKKESKISWINVDGLHQVEIIERIGSAFGLHSLILEDIVHTEQRSKFEDLGDYLFLIIKMISYNETSDQVMTEQFSLVMGQGFVLSFQERPGDVFDQVRKRLRKKIGRIRKSGSDYLSYALLDAVIDNYFEVLGKVGEKIEALEDKVMEQPDTDTLNSLHLLNRELIFLRKALWPMRELIGNLGKWESPLIHEKTIIFINDLYDHVFQIIESVGVFRDLATSMREIYNSSVSNRLNQAMKLLTIVATLFIPLTFIAGIYGMNFKSMPELEWSWGYPLALGVMGASALCMLFWFRKLKLL